jgi:hypothetical protein
LPPITTSGACSPRGMSASERGGEPECRRQSARCMATKGRPGRSSEGNLWSALQTHLQGVDRGTLAVMPEECRHRAALLSRSSDADK